MGTENKCNEEAILKTLKGILDKPKFQTSVDDLTPEAIKDYYVEFRHEIVTVYNVFKPNK